MNTQQIQQATNLLNSLYNPSFNQPVKKEIITVSGLQDARDFKLDKGESVALIDSNADILYLKECDTLGKSTFKVFECIDKTEQYLNESTPAFISKDEFQKLSNNVNKLMEMLEGAKEYNVTKQQQKQPVAKV